MTLLPRPLRPLIVSVAALFLMFPAGAAAGPGFGIQKLRLGSTTGLEDYLYTAGNTIVAQGGADKGNFYTRFTVSQPGSVVAGVYTPGPAVMTTGCVRVPSNGVVTSTYTVKSSDPASGTYPYQFRLDEFTTSACSGTPAAGKTKSLYFDVAKASVFGDSGMTMPKTAFMASATAYVSVTGAGNVNKGNPTASQTSPTGSWNTTWILPSLLTACANTAGGDRAGNTAAGVFPATSPLQYAPGVATDTWNQSASYNGACPAMSSSNQGQWQLKLQRDNMHFVTVPVFTVDTTPPDTSLSGAPSEGAFSGVDTATFTFASTEAQSHFECNLNGAGFSACTSPLSLSGLPQGANSFSVRAIDAAGNVDGTPATRNWHVDTTFPHVTLTTPDSSSFLKDSTPPLGGAAGNATGDDTHVSVTVYSGSDTSGSVVRTFSAQTGGGSTWSVDDAAWAGGSPSSLPDGTYTVQAAQSDDAANTAMTDANTFTVDTHAPKPTLALPTGGSFTNDDQPDVSGGAGTQSADATHSADNGTVTVEVYSGAAVVPANLIQTIPNVAIAGGAWHTTLAALPADGVYTVRVLQGDGAGNTGTGAPHTFTLDTQAPTTAIDGGPAGDTGSTTATFSFSSSESGSTFQCSLDNGPVTNCTSPKTYNGLAAGAHTFTVNAVDRAGNADPNPPVANWTVNTSLPAVSLVHPVSGSSTSDTTPTFTGDSGTNSGDSATVTVKVYNQSAPTTVIETLTTTRSAGDGAWSVDASPALPEGTYLAHAEQTGTSGTGFSSTHVFTVDTSAPQTNLTALPQTTTSATSATFTFSSSENGSSFQCSLDGAAFTACTSPQSYSGLSAGSHTFQVRAVDGAGNTDPTPASQTWTIDTSLPQVTIASPGNGDHISDASPTISGGSSTGGTTSSTISVDIYQVVPGQPLGSPVQSLTTSRDPGTGAWSLTATSLPEGMYEAFASQGSGSGTGMSSGQNFTIDLTPPSTTIVLGPQGSTGSTSATFRFTSSEAGSTFMCSLDGAAFSICTSPQSYTSLSNGDHTFAVEAVDAAGNVDPNPDVTTWTVNTVSALSISFSSPADASSVNSTTPVFTGTASHAAGVTGVTVEIIDPSDGSTVATYGPTAVPNNTGAWSTSGVASPTPLADGDYIAFAEQNDSGGTTYFSDARAFTVDTVAPDVALTAPLSGLSTQDTTPTVSGTAGSDPGDDGTVTVKIYSGTSASGTPVRTLSSVPVSNGTWSVDVTPALPDGTYTARAQHGDAAGNVGTSNRRSFTVDTTAPDTSISSGPAASTAATDAQFAFTSGESGSTFECKLDGGPFSACTSPQSYSGLALGAHTFSVRATDAAGNTDASPATATWTVTAPASPTPTPTPSPVTPTTPTTPSTGENQTANPDELVLAVRLGGCVLRVKTLRHPSLAKTKGRIRIALLSQQACTVKAGISVKLPKSKKGARAAALLRSNFTNVKLSVGKERKITLRFSPKAMRTLAAQLKKNKSLLATISLTGGAKSHKVESKRVSVRLTK
jgi:hypothetical protein